MLLGTSFQVLGIAVTSLERERALRPRPHPSRPPRRGQSIRRRTAPWSCEGGWWSVRVYGLHRGTPKIIDHKPLNIIFISSYYSTYYIYTM